MGRPAAIGEWGQALDSWLQRPDGTNGILGNSRMGEMRLRGENPEFAFQSIRFEMPAKLKQAPETRPAGDGRARLPR